MASRSILAAALLLVLSGLGALAWSRTARPAEVTVEPAQLPTAAPLVSTAPPPLVLQYGAPPTVRQPASQERRHLLALPNGDFVPALNGVLDAPAMIWPSEIPYSPIIGTERAASGQEWYVHADGARSTTSMVFRSDEGRLSPVTTLSLPTPTVKVLDER